MLTQSIIKTPENEDMRVLAYSIQDATICKVCHNKLCDPYICMKCKKSACSNCLKSFIEKDHKCPMCLRETDLKNIKKNASLIATLNIANQIISNNLSKRCPSHKSQNLNFFCVNCSKTLCYDCLILNQHNNSHKIMDIKDYEGCSFQQLINLCNDLHYYYDQLLTDIDLKIKTMEMNRIKAIDYLEEIKNETNQQYYKCMNTLKNFRKKREENNELIKELINKLNKLKENFKNESNININIGINDALKKLNSNFYLKDQINSFLNININPIYEFYNKIMFNFEVPYYKEMLTLKEKEIINQSGEKTTGDYVVSAYTYVNFFKWCIRVYPRGRKSLVNNNSNNAEPTTTSGYKYMSVFVGKEKLKENFLIKYTGEITLVNFWGEEKNFSKTFTSNFENGDLVGFDEFYLYENLEKEGFINKDGSIKIECRINPEGISDYIDELKCYQVINNMKYNSEETVDLFALHK